MPCPKCRGKRRKELAPGYYECRSEVTIAMTPDGIPVPDVCKKRYQEGPGVGKLCFCGTVAVRFCTECDEPLCGEHGVLYARFSATPKWHCKPCKERKDAAIAEKAAAQREERRLAYSKLPAIDRTTLEGWVTGQLPREVFRDGVTHRADDWKCADVARLLCELLGEPDYDYILQGRDGDAARELGYGRQRREIGDESTKLPPERGQSPESLRHSRPRTVGDTVLTHDGRVMAIRDGYDYNGNHPRADKRLNSPGEPFTAVFTADAFSHLRKTFDYNKENVRRARVEREDKARSYRHNVLVSRIQAVGCFVVLIAAILLVVWLVSS